MDGSKGRGLCGALFCFCLEKLQFLPFNGLIRNHTGARAIFPVPPQLPEKFRWNTIMPEQSSKIDEAQKISELEEQVRSLQRRLDEKQSLHDSASYQLKLAHAILDNIPHFATVKDRRGRYLMVNRAACKIVGKSNAEIVGSTPFDLYPEVIAEKIHNDDMEVIRTGGTLTTEETLSLDSDRHYFTTKVPLFDEEGEPDGLIGLAVDITELKQAQSLLAEREAQLSAIFNNAALGIVVTDSCQRMLQANKHFLTMLGYEREEDLLRLTVREITHPDHRQQSNTAKSNLRSGNSDYIHMEKRYLRRDGSFFWGEVFVTPVKNSRDEENTCVAMIHDIDERKKAHQALEYRVRYERLISQISSEMINLGIDEIDSAVDRVLRTIGEFADVDRSYVFLFDLDDRTMDNTHEWCRQGIASQIDRLKNIPIDEFGWITKRTLGNETICIENLADLPGSAAPEKQEFELEGIQSLVMVPLSSAGKVIGFVGFDAVRERKAWPEDMVSLLNLVGDTIANALERRRAEKALRESEERFREMAEMLPETIFETDIKGDIIFANHSAFEQLAISAEDLARPVNIFDFLRSEDRGRVTDELLRLFEGEEVGLKQVNVLRGDGSSFPALVSASTIMKNGVPAGARGFVVDITERQQRERERRRASNLEAVGLLAGGIAHDFNNILASITGYVNMAQITSARGEEFDEYLESAEAAALRARDLTQQLLTFSRGGVPVKASVSVSQLIESSAGIALIGSNVSCELDIEKGLWPADIDEGQISQVLNNVIINAKQAMPDGGVIRISAKNLNLSGSKNVPPVAEGRYIVITIADHGVGITADRLDKIFDPYFTTKPDGTGLGLATSYSIVRKHDGHIEVESAPDEGAKFTIYLPASSAKSAGTGAEGKGKPYSGGRILLMEDDEDVIKATTGIIESYGNEVEHARDGSEALTSYESAMKEGRPFDVVVMDLTIPGGMGGEETIGRLLELDPKARVIVSSGYSEDAVIANHRDYGFAAAIPKPYNHKQLLDVISKVVRD